MNPETGHDGAEPVPQSIELTELEPAPAGDRPLLGANFELIRGVKVTLSTSVGHCDITIAELFALKEGEVLTLERGTDEPVDLYLGTKLVGRGELVAVGDNFGVRIVEIGHAAPR